jgi:hypothetical protein
VIVRLAAFVPTAARVIAAIILLAVPSELPLPASADITAANVNRDRAAFVKCGDALDSESQSAEAFRNAITVCFASLKHYTDKADSAYQSRNHEDACYYSLYAGGSWYRYAYLLSKSMNAGKAKTAYAYGDTLLKGVISDCSRSDPNIVNAAKGMMQASKATR